MSTAAELLADAMLLLAEHREIAGAGELLARYEQLVADNDVQMFNGCGQRKEMTR